MIINKVSLKKTTKKQQKTMMDHGKNGNNKL